MGRLRTLIGSLLCVWGVGVLRTLSPRQMKRHERCMPDQMSLAAGHLVDVDSGVCRVANPLRRLRL